MRRQPQMTDDTIFRFIVLVLLFGIFWAITTDYHLEIPEMEGEPQPMTAQEKAIYVWVFYILGMMVAWLIFLIIKGDQIRQSIRGFWKRRKERRQDGGSRHGT